MENFAFEQIDMISDAAGAETTQKMFKACREKKPFTP
jgi:hypothetical protein